MSQNTEYDYLLSALQKKSKHSQYQEIHPKLAAALGLDNSVFPGNSKFEAERWNWMRSQLDLTGLSVLDIGANTGFFSFAAIESGARYVIAIEGNASHAFFLRSASRILQIEKQFRAEESYFDFGNPGGYGKTDVIFCLNVLHHLGDDFDRASNCIDGAKRGIVSGLRALSFQAKYCWFQLGFNWKGNRTLPLFKNGIKTELIDFVGNCCANFWDVKTIGVYNPETKAYEALNERLLERFDTCGEFLNRPLFLLKSARLEN